MTTPTPPAPFHATPFVPRRWLTNAHLQTIFGNQLPRHSTLPAPHTGLVETIPAHGSQISTQVLCDCHWQPAAVRSARLTVLILHGLEGSSASQYVIGNAAKLFAAGCNVIRMNMRNCGGSTHGFDMARLSPTLYHSGLSADVASVLRHFIHTQHLPSVAMIGYSMGGNLVLKLAGELGSGSAQVLGAPLCAVVGVSPAVDLAASADALHLLSNRFYERRFLRALLKRFRRKAAIFPRAYDLHAAAGIHTLRDFDDRITALYSGFQSADDYYFRAAAARVLPHIAVPTLILHAADDPFIRFTPATRAAILANPHITWIETAHGGHCAFLAQPTPHDVTPHHITLHDITPQGIIPHDDGYWAETTSLRFLLAHV